MKFDASELIETVKMRRGILFMETCLANHAIQQWNQTQTKVGKNGIKLCVSDIIATAEKLTAEHNAGILLGPLCPTKPGIS